VEQIKEYEQLSHVPAAEFLLNSQIKKPLAMLDVDEHLSDSGIFVELVWDRTSQRGTHSSSSKRAVS